MAKHVPCQREFQAPENIHIILEILVGCTPWLVSDTLFQWICKWIDGGCNVLLETKASTANNGSGMIPYLDAGSQSSGKIPQCNCVTISQNQRRTGHWKDHETYPPQVSSISSILLALRRAVEPCGIPLLDASTTWLCYNWCRTWENAQYCWLAVANVCK